MSELVLLGTGAADGWPNPFCRCASCQAVRAAGERRTHTSALLDGAVLIDCGPDTPAAATAAGTDLAGVRHLLLTHDHFDHVAGQALLMRSWAQAAEPLEVIGPPAALAVCRDWIGADDPVRLCPVAPGETIALPPGPGNAPGGYRVTVLAAEHRSVTGEPGVLYDITALGADGERTARLLWACDTGPLPAATLDAAAGARYDAVLLEQTFGRRTDHGADHHDLVTFPRTLAALRAGGAITERTDTVAVHLSHHNPPPGELARILAGWDTRLGADGMTLRLGAPDAGAQTPGGQTGAAGTGAHRTLVLGGVRSGKSAHAEQLLADRAQVTYVATGGLGRTDAEWLDRVQTHRKRRPDHWRTIETLDLVGVLAAATGPVLIDCLGTWLTGMMDRHRLWDGLETAPSDSGAARERALAAVTGEVDRLLAAWDRVAVPVIAVSNEVGSGVVPASASGRLFRDELGRLNTRVAAASEQVLLIVAGRALAL